jgi:hypothetical protein
VVTDLSPDGTTLLINEVSAGAGTPLYAVYVRKADGSPAVRIGEGALPALSPDGRWAAAVILGAPNFVTLLPTGPGQARTLDRGNVRDVQAVAWFPDGRRLLVAGSEAGAGVRLWTQNVEDGPPTPIGREGLWVPPYSQTISPDGASALALGLDGQMWQVPLSGGGEPRVISGVEKGDIPIRWAADGRSFYLFQERSLPAAIYRFELATGVKELIRTVTPADVTGVARLGTIQLTPDARSFVYSYSQTLSDLYLLANVR